MYVVMPGRFYDVEKNLSALDVTSLCLAFTCVCKARGHEPRHVSSFYELMEDDCECPAGTQTS